MSFPTYEKLVASGVEWIGDVPYHWLKSRVKFDASLKARVGWHGLKSDEFTEIGPYLVTGSDFKGREVSWNDCYHCTVERYEQDKNIQLQTGDLLITKDGTIGKLMLIKSLPGKATLNSGIFVVRPLNESLSTDFYYWLLQSSVFYQFINAYQSGTTINHLYQETFGNLPYAKPQKSEQTQIARFLDHETAKIDALIAEQKRLIKLLQEKRQAVISHAVTKGLDPNVPMKDSGIEWLGEVPAHWGVRKLSHLTSKIGSGKTPKGGALSYVDSGIKLIRSQNVYDEGLRLADIAYIAKEVDDEMYWSRVQAGDILLNITGGSIGRTCTVSKHELPANVNQHVCIIRLGYTWKDYLDWLALFLKSALVKEQISFNQTGSGREGLNFEQLSNFRVPVPPLAEAQSIVKLLKEELSEIEQLNTHAFICSDLLKERRSAIISAAVTGKIDVRDWQPPADESAFDEGVRKAGLEASA